MEAKDEGMRMKGGRLGEGVEHSRGVTVAVGVERKQKEGGTGGVREQSKRGWKETER